MMPRMDGFELLEALQADPLTVGVPVVMLSARAGEDGTLEGLDAGADDYLVKPFTARELLARVRANLELDRARRTRRQLERSRSLLDQAQRLARVGSWEIDLATGQVEVSDEFLRIDGPQPRGARGAGLATRSWSWSPTPTTGTGCSRTWRRGDGLRLPLRVPDRPLRRQRDPGRGLRRGGARRARRAGGAARLGAGHHRAPGRRGGAGAGRRQRRGGRARALDRRPAAAQPAAADRLRPRAPRGRDLLPGRRRGHPGRRRLVRRHRARRRPHRAGRRRRDGPRRPGRRGDGPAPGRGAGLRPARPAAGRPAGVPRRPGPRPRRGPDRHLHLRRLRPRRPGAAVRQRRPPAADRGDPGRRVPRWSRAPRTRRSASGRST